jgi:hypothetical protein
MAHTGGGGGGNLFQANEQDELLSGHGHDAAFPSLHASEAFHGLGCKKSQGNAGLVLLFSSRTFGIPFH